MSLLAGRNNVYYVGVARLADRVVVAQHSYNVKTDPDSVKTVLRQQMNMRPGTVYNFDVSGTTWHLTGDDAGRVFILITRSQYPLRFAHQCLEEFQRTFVAKVGDKSLKANENGLTRTMSTHLTKLCAKYDNLEELDQLTALNAKVQPFHRRALAAPQYLRECCGASLRCRWRASRSPCRRTFGRRWRGRTRLRRWRSLRRSFKPKPVCSRSR